MNILLSTGVIALSLLPFLTCAQQANTITFKGEISTQTCDVSINGEKSSPVVLLPTVTNSELVTAGSTAGNTNFTINLSNCNNKLMSAKAVLVGNNITTAGNLGNTGTATKVSIQLKDGQGNSIFNFNNSNITSVASTITSGSGSLPFTASYYAEGDTVTSGSVIATVQYAISYE